MEEVKTVFEIEREKLCKIMEIIRKCGTLSPEDLHGKYRKAYLTKLNEACQSCGVVMFLGITQFCYFAPGEAGEELRKLAMDRIKSIAPELKNACLKGNMDYVDEKIEEMHEEFYSKVYLNDSKYYYCAS